MSPSVRVVSYNVLSSHLGSASYFTACKPCHLEPSKRLPKVFSRLETELEQGNNGKNPVIFCLQEVSHDWAGDFHTFFANRGYHMVTGLYGKKFNGYMGVALAYPTDVYETLAVDISRLSDKRVEGWPYPPKEEEEEGSITLFRKASELKKSIKKNIFQYFLTPMKKMLLTNDKPRVIDHWEMSRNRFNILLSVGLREKSKSSNSEGDDNDDSNTFWISNYHMPCAFYAPMVMNMHAELAARHIQGLACKKTTTTTDEDENASTDIEDKKEYHPYILAGDFNLMPDSAHYRMLTEGKIDKSDATYPTPKYGMEWNCDNIVPMQSAYAAANDGVEPDFTNYSKVKEDEPFIGTLDYIFCSNDWKVNGVKSLEHRSKIVNPPFPNEEEPSDHYLIAADLEIAKSH